MPLSALSLSCLKIEMYFENTYLANGTAFLWRHDNDVYLATNRHNVTGKNNDTGKCINQKTACIPDRLFVNIPNLFEMPSENERRGRVHIDKPRRLEIKLLEDFEPLWLEHAALGKQADLVFMPVKEVDFPVLRCVNDIDSGVDSPLSPSDRVSVIGFPSNHSVEDTFPIWVNGFVASEPQMNFNKLPVFLIDCRTRPGSSGSPVFTYAPYGEVDAGVGEKGQYNEPIQKFWGIYSGRISEESDIGRVWKKSVLETFFDLPIPSSATSPIDLNTSNFP